MITSIDSSVLVDHHQTGAWSGILARGAYEGGLSRTFDHLLDITFAELAPSTTNELELVELLGVCRTLQV